jgi:hypothetical protein
LSSFSQIAVLVVVCSSKAGLVLNCAPIIRAHSNKYSHPIGSITLSDLWKMIAILDAEPHKEKADGRRVSSNPEECQAGQKPVVW